METLKEIKETRDLLIAEISGDNYSRLLKDYSDELGGMIGVSRYIIDIVDKLIDSDEFKDAVNYELNGNGSIWDYMHFKFDDCLDWHFLDKANEIINRDYPKLSNK